MDTNAKKITLQQARKLWEELELAKGTTEAKIAMKAIKLALFVSDQEISSDVMAAKSDIEAYRLVQDKFLNRIMDEETKEERKADYLFNALRKGNSQNYLLILQKITSALIGASFVDDEGNLLTSNGDKADDDLFMTIPGRSADPWKGVWYYNPADGSTSTTPRTGFTPVNIVEVVLSDNTSFIVTINDAIMLARAIRDDIRNRETIIWRLLAESGRDPITGKDIGKTGLIREMIVDEAKKTRFPELCCRDSKVLAVAKSGNVVNMVHIYILALETIVNMPEDEAKRLIVADDIERYLKMIKLLGVATNEDQKKILTDDMLDSFLDDRGQPLTGINHAGLIVSGSDNNVIYKRLSLRQLAETAGMKLLGISTSMTANTTASINLKQSIFKVLSSIQPYVTVTP